MAVRKHNPTGKSFKKYGASEGLNESKDDALFEEGKSLDHNDSNDNVTVAMNFWGSKVINTFALQQYLV
jgi:hypothetical protein